MSQNQFYQIPKIKRALSRVIEYECRRPGEFKKWLEDLHIEHYRAGFTKTNKIQAIVDGVVVDEVVINDAN